jgi:hypothetical protein
MALTKDVMALTTRCDAVMALTKEAMALTT